MDILISEKKYGDKLVLKNTNLSFVKGQVTCIVGESGCGKSTLLNVLAGFDDGFIGKRSVASTSYITQDSSLLERYTVKENLSFIAKENYDLEKFNLYAKILGLTELMDKRVNKLSGGQRQRVGILRGILLDVDFILLDEPTSSLDIENIHTLMKLLQSIAINSNIGIIISTHERAVIGYCENIIEYEERSFIYKKQIAKQNKLKNTEKLRKKPLTSQFLKYYTRYFGMKLIYLFSLIVVIFVLIFSLKSFENYLSSDYDTIVNSLSDNKIGIQKINYDKNCGEESCVNYQKFDDLTFSNAELEEFKSSDKIESVEGLYLPQNTTKTDSNGNELYIEVPSDYYSKNLKYLEQVRRDLISKKDDTDYLNIPTDYLKYEFIGVPVSENYIETYGYLSNYYLLSNILYGSNNFENENDIVVPKNLAIYYCDINNLTLEELINKDVKIKLTNSTFQTYRVIGIYDDRLVKTFPDLGHVYVKNKTINSNIELYQKYQEIYASVEAFEEMYPDEKSFLDKNQTADNVVVLTVDPDNIDDVCDYLVKKYPNAIVFDKNSYIQEHYKKDKLIKDISIKIVLVISFLILLVSMIFNHRLFLRSNKNDIKVFKELSYSSKKVINFYYLFSTAQLIIIFLILAVIGFEIYIVPVLISHVLMMLFNKSKLY